MFTTKQAIVLGLLQGPAELLPISSSAHSAIAAWTLKIPYEQLDPAFRKNFEVALHTGTSIALIPFVDYSRHSLRLALVSCLPTALIGLLLERPIERRLGNQKATGIGLVLGSLLSLLTKYLTTQSGKQDRVVSEATSVDALKIGVAQSCALIPGISRQSATFTIAEALKFTPKDAQILADNAAAPVLIAASGLRIFHTLKKQQIAQSQRYCLLAGTTSAAISSLISTSCLKQSKLRRKTALWAFYRLILGLVIIRSRKNPKFLH